VRRPPAPPKISKRRRGAQPAGGQPWQAPGLSRAARVCAFVESLPCTAGQWAGTVFKLRPWQRREIEAIYRTDAAGRRIVRRVVWSTARGNGKTGICAVLALAHFVGPESEERGEIYACANDRFQSNRLFAEVAAVVQRVEWLRDRISIRRHEKTMEDVISGSVFAALSADVPSKFGLSPTFVCLDELGQARSRAQLDAMQSALGKRENPLLVIISTQGPTDAQPMSEAVDYGLKQRTGAVAVDPAFHLVLHAAPPDLDPWAESTWAIANPGLNDLVDIEHLRQQANEARHVPSAEAAFRNLHLNQRVSPSDCFISPDVWRACGDPVDFEALKRVKCCCGLDLSTAQDLTAFAVVGQVDGKTHAHVIHWLPRVGLYERGERHHKPYVAWAEKGYLELTEGPTIDYDQIAGYLRDKVFSQFNIERIAYDPYNWTFFKAALLRAGITEQFIDERFVAFRQGFLSMNEPIRALEAMLLEKKIAHGNHPVLSMCALQAIVLHDGTGNRKLDKDGYLGKIDGLVAAVMAIGIMPLPTSRDFDVETLIG
jgi:phage terminase large subunit-like protein